MKSGDGAWVQGYNGQAAVDADFQVIVAQELTQQAADPTHLEAMIEQVGENTGFVPAETSADAGYFSKTNVEYLETLESEALIPPDRQRHGSPATLVASLTRTELALLSTSDRQRHLTSTASGRAKYARREVTVEPVFGQIKGCPAVSGFRGFLRRGLKKCQQEWGYICATHNFKKYIRFQWAQKRGQQGPLAAT